MHDVTPSPPHKVVTRTRATPAALFNCLRLARALRTCPAVVAAVRFARGQSAVECGLALVGGGVPLGGLAAERCTVHCS